MEFIAIGIDSDGQFSWLRPQGGKEEVDTLAHLGSPPLGNVTDMDGLVAKLSVHASDSRRGDWIVGWSYDDTALAEARHPTRADLEEGSATRRALWNAMGAGSHERCCLWPVLT